MRTAKLIATALLLAGCAKQTPSSGLDTVLKNVAVPGRQTERSVVYGSRANEDCRAISERVNEVLNAPESEAPIRGLAARDVQGRFAPYRAYFLPSQLIDANKAAFAFCEGESAALVPVKCRLLGTTSSGCFQTGIYGIADAAGIEATVNAIRLSWPDSLEEGEQ